MLVQLGYEGTSSNCPLLLVVPHLLTHCRKFYCDLRYEASPVPHQANRVRRMPRVVGRIHPLMTTRLEDTDAKIPQRANHDEHNNENRLTILSSE